MNIVKTICMMVLLIPAPAFAGRTDTGTPSEPGKGAAAPERAWENGVKETYRTYLENGRLSALPEIQDSQLPPAAFRQLKRGIEQRNAGRSQCATAVYLLTVGGKRAFAVHNGCGGRVAAHIFDHEGRLIAAGSAGPGARFQWRDACALPKAYGADRGSGHHHGQPDGPYDGGPDGSDDGYQDSGSGPDDTDDGGGCGGSGSGGGDGGFDGSGGLPF